MVQAILALLAGLADYLILRSGTYIHRIIKIPPEYCRSELEFFGDSFIRFALPDFLWGYSLTFAIFAIILPSKNKSITIAVFAAICGIIWELLQLAAIVSGTFDIFDCIMYISAAFISNIIYLVKEKTA